MFGTNPPQSHSFFTLPTDSLTSSNQHDHTKSIPEIEQTPRSLFHFLAISPRSLIFTDEDNLHEMVRGICNTSSTTFYFDSTELQKGSITSDIILEYFCKKLAEFLKKPEQELTETVIANCGTQINNAFNNPAEFLQNNSEVKATYNEKIDSMHKLYADSLIDAINTFNANANPSSQRITYVLADENTQIQEDSSNNIFLLDKKNIIAELNKCAQNQEMANFIIPFSKVGELGLSRSHSIEEFSSRLQDEKFTQEVNTIAATEAKNRILNRTQRYLRPFSAKINEILEKKEELQQDKKEKSHSNADKLLSLCIPALLAGATETTKQYFKSELPGIGYARSIGPLHYPLSDFASRVFKLGETLCPPGARLHPLTDCNKKIGLEKIAAMKKEGMENAAVLTALNQAQKLKRIFNKNMDALIQLEEKNVQITPLTTPPATFISGINLIFYIAEMKTSEADDALKLSFHSYQETYGPTAYNTWLQELDKYCRSGTAYIQSHATYILAIKKWAETCNEAALAKNKQNTLDEKIEDKNKLFSISKETSEEIIDESGLKYEIDSEDSFDANADSPYETEYEDNSGSDVDSLFESIEEDLETLYKRLLDANEKLSKAESPSDWNAAYTQWTTAYNNWARSHENILNNLNTIKKAVENPSLKNLYGKYKIDLLNSTPASNNNRKAKDAKKTKYPDDSKITSSFSLGERPQSMTENAGNLSQNRVLKYFAFSYTLSSTPTLAEQNNHTPPSEPALSEHLQSLRR